MTDKAIEAAVKAFFAEPGLEVIEVVLEKAIAAYTSALLPEDVAGLVERLRRCADREGFGRANGEHGALKEAAAALTALSARLVEAERERDEAGLRIEELELDAGKVSDEFEQDCWKALKALLNKCNFDWSYVDEDGVTADDAKQHILESINDQDRALELAEARIAALERELAEIRAALNDDLNVTDDELLRIRNGCEGANGHIRVGATMLQKLVDAIRASRSALVPRAALAEKGAER